MHRWWSARRRRRPRRDTGGNVAEFSFIGDEKPRDAA
jgi:hypothetical protein